MRLRPFALAIASGATYEAMSVVWVHQATHGTALSTALVSGLQALAIVLGVGESVRNWRTAPFYVIGYASGAYGAMVLR
jgi:ABC-type Fe3+-siderophore transport system permease subunit